MIYQEVCPGKYCEGLYEKERKRQRKQNCDKNCEKRLTSKSHEGLDGGGGGGGVYNSLISKNLAHYSLSLNFLLIL